MRAKIVPDEAEDEGFGHSKARTTTKYEPIFAATLGPKRAAFARLGKSRRDGASFPHLVVACRFSRPATARSSLLDLGKTVSRRRHPR